MAKKIISFCLLALLGIATASIALAATSTVEAPPTRFGSIVTGITSGADFITLVEGITNWIFVFLLVAATIFIVLAGWQFITGGGDPQAVSQARSKLLWAAVGILVALLSRGFVLAISNLVT